MASRNLSPERGLSLLDAVSEALALPDPAEGYRSLSLLLNTALREGTEDSNMLFANPFARMDYLCRELNYPPLRRVLLNGTRNRVRLAQEFTEAQQQQGIAEDAQQIAELIARLYKAEIPESLRKRLPAHEIIKKPRTALSESAKMVVERWDDTYVCGELENKGTAKVLYNTNNRFGEWGYLGKLFHRGMLLSLVRPTEVDGGSITADLIICLPDLLINITSITRCITPVGKSSLWYLLNLFTPTVTSMPMLLGSFSGQLLDARLHNRENKPTDYTKNARDFFHHNGLKILQQHNAGTLKEFHKLGREQLHNINAIVTKQLPELQGYNLEKVVLEPTILCDTLGLQGRMDLLQSDYRVLIEQKSGKCDEWLTKQVNNGNLYYQETHYAQFLLYQAMLRYGLHIPNEQVSGALLYSKYRNGLIRTGPAPALLGQCISLRNMIAHLDYLLAQGKLKDIIEELDVDDFHTGKSSTTLWDMYIGPRVNRFIQTFRNASPLALAYFYRFATFISLERLLGRIGSPQRQIDGYASIWTASPAEKLEAGVMLNDLSVASLVPSEEGNGAAKIVFQIPPQQDNSSTNFRAGDIVVLYSYETHQTPDATSGILLRGSIDLLSAQQVVVALRAPQRNVALFLASPSRRWAIEHDRYETSEERQLQSIFSLFSCSSARRDLLLSQRTPQIDPTLSLLKDHTLPNGNREFNTLALRAKRARDVFLIVGPPGTGKTSYGLMCILREELASPQTNVLLLACTNRAVDEICAKLEKDGINYLRLGSRQGCGERYRLRLLREATKECTHVEGINSLVTQTRVFTGTVSALLSATELLQLKSFSLAIVDEASQVIEPDLIGLLCAMRGSLPAIERFVLIGDQCQLPAVVTQSFQASAVTDDSLRTIGLHDCRESLFERFYRLYAEDPNITYRLTLQGRMHPDVADFANRNFYGARLLAVPLPHQSKTLQLIPPTQSRLHALLCAHRTLFFNVPASSDTSSTRSGKSNTAEAAAIASIIKAAVEIYQSSNKVIEPSKQIGVIVPYRNQISQIRMALHSAARNYLSTDEIESITIDTVERFQGSERDIIIYGLTLQHPFQLAFLTESRANIDNQLVDRKLNVALTRAREQMILVGNAPLLQRDVLYKRLIDDYASRREVIFWDSCAE